MGVGVSVWSQRGSLQIHQQVVQSEKTVDHEYLESTVWSPCGGGSVRGQARVRLHRTSAPSQPDSTGIGGKSMAG